MNATCSRYLMPLPGLYDNDLLTDLVTYDPQTAIFHTMSSQAGYSFFNTVDRGFSGAFIAGSSGGSYSRSGAVPLTNLYRSFRDSTLGANAPWVTRLGIGLWQPWNGRTDIMWDPVGSSTVDFSCEFGGADTSSAFPSMSGQIPLGGLGTNFTAPQSGTACSEPGLYSPQLALNGNPDVVAIVTSPVCSCSTAISTTQTISDATTARWLVLSVGDMDGDGKADILRRNPDTGAAAYIKSSTTFSTSYALPTIGAARANLL